MYIGYVGIYRRINYNPFSKRLRKKKKNTAIRLHGILLFSKPLVVEQKKQRNRKRSDG